MKAFDFDFRWRAPENRITVEDFRRAARRRLPHVAWAYLDGGAEDLATLHDNREAFSRWSFRPRMLTGAGTPTLATSVAGVPLSMPVLLAPTAFSGLTYWRGDIAAMKAAETAGTRYIASTMSSWSLEEIAEAASLPHFFQLYPGTGDLAARLMTRAWTAGFRVLFVTVDVPIVGNRESERRRGMGLPPVLTPWRMLNIARHPLWAYQTLTRRRIAARNLVSGGGLGNLRKSVEIQSREMTQFALTWDDLAWMRDQWRGPLFVKGILEPDDAERAASLGVDGVVVSNHGGRQLDFASGSLDALPDIVSAVRGRAEILVDGGVRRGTDVVKAIALGARAVLVGRPYLYGLAVAGQRGAEQVLAILARELESTLTLLGAPGVAALDASWVKPRRFGFQPGPSS